MIKRGANRKTRKEDDEKHEKHTRVNTFTYTRNITTYSLLNRNCNEVFSLSTRIRLVYLFQLIDY